MLSRRKKCFFILSTMRFFFCVFLLNFDNHCCVIASAPTVPGAVPSQSLRATPFEDRILLYWKEPTEPNGIIIQYEVLFGGAKKKSRKETVVLLC